MSLADDLIPVVDAARSLIEDLGFRPRVVAVQTNARAGVGLAALGGAGTNTTLTLDPRPRVRGMPDTVSEADGLAEEGDLTVRRISKTYTRAQLDPGGNSVWLVDGEPYRLVSLEERALEWMAVIRRAKR